MSEDDELIAALRLHAFDDCGEKEPPPTHVCIQAADRLSSVRREAIEEAVPQMRPIIRAALEMVENTSLSCGTIEERAIQAIRNLLLER